MPKTDSRDVTLLSAIVSSGSLSAAARRMGLSPASISARLANMEQKLGVTLLRRTSKLLRLTGEGQHYLDTAGQILAILDEAEDIVSQSRQPVSAISGMMSVGAPIDLGRQYVAVMTDSFMEKYPDIQIFLRLSDEVEDLYAQGIDLSVRYGPMRAVSGIVTSALADNHRVICASTEYLDRAGRPVVPGDIAKLNCLCLRTGTSHINKWNIGGRKIVVDGDRCSDNGAVLRDWALAGLGVVMKSWWDVRVDIEAGRLEILFADQPKNQHPLRLARPADGRVPLRVRLLAKHLKDKFQSYPQAA